MQTQEVTTDNNQLVSAIELDALSTLVYGLMGYNPNGLPFEVSVWPDADAPERSFEEVAAVSLEELAPLHQEFHDSWENAVSAMERVKDEINLGLFKYNPPVLPVH